jgi:hypothetical protein
LLAVCVLLGLPSKPEDEGGIFLRNVGSLSADYIASCPGRQNFITTGVRSSNPAGLRLTEM